MSQKTSSPARKTLTVTAETYKMLAAWKGGENRGVSFDAAIAMLVEFAAANGYPSALADPKK